jgi:hypothetical protein
MRRPASTEEALSRSPLIEASRANSPGVKCVPKVAAGTSPEVFLARRPATKRASDSRRFRLAGLPVFLKLAVWSDDQIVRNGSHTQLL